MNIHFLCRILKLTSPFFIVHFYMSFTYPPQKTADKMIIFRPINPKLFIFVKIV